MRAELKQVMGNCGARYEHSLATAQAEEKALGSKAGLLSTLRLAGFVGGVTLWILVALSKIPSLPGTVGAVICAVSFVILVVLHDRVLVAQARAARVCTWCREGLARLADRPIRKAQPSDPQGEPNHPYLSDLDIFGPKSLFMALDTTQTPAGRNRLANYLRAPSPPNIVLARQEAAKDLIGRPKFRQDLAVEGALLAKDPPALEELLVWSESQTPFLPGWLHVAALLLALVTIAALSITPLFVKFGVPKSLLILPVSAQILVLFVLRSRTSAGLTAASRHADGLARFGAMFARVEAESFEAPMLKTLHAGMVGASAAVRRLARIVSFVDARQNEVFRLFIGPLLMWDVHCAVALDRFRRTAGSRLRRELDYLAEIEALNALGTRAEERPDDAWPDILPREMSQANVTSGAASGAAPGTEPPELSAEGLGHPLLSTRALVRNDVRFGGTSPAIWLVTGSNMSGKSTMLRALGCNVVLALAGAPVRARSFRTSVFSVHTSMRISDSLDEGVSHFFAELARLKSVVDAADRATAERPVLFLLDEILHGTNSRERQLGASAVVKHLAKTAALGAVSTHDLGLSALERQLPGIVTNKHFCEQVGPADPSNPSGAETMTFDYQLRAGPVTSSNALRLMKMVGIDLSALDETSVSAPVEPAPVEPAPVEPAPVEPG